MNDSYRDYLTEILKTSILYQEEFAGFEIDIFANTKNLDWEFACLAGDKRKKTRLYRGISLTLNSVLEMLITRSGDGILTAEQWEKQQQKEIPFAGYKPASEKKEPPFKGFLKSTKEGNRDSLPFFIDEN
jgi:hypothetical protein